MVQKKITKQHLQLFFHLNPILRNYDVVFCWIPSHIGITGNEKADQAAKYVLNSTSLFTHYHILIVQLLFKKHLSASWQHLWHNLSRVYPSFRFKY